MICASFVGMNHHSNNIMLGCGFVMNERIEPFEWLFQTFLKSLSGKLPSIIMTDPAFSMAARIDSVFGGVQHRLLF